MISRRKAMTALAGVPVIGRSAAAALAKQQAGCLVGVGEMAKSSLGGVGQAIGQQCMPNGPKLQEWQAVRLAMKDPDIRKLLIDAAQEQCRVVTGIDPDIEILRSVSPMAKITFQRQRNVRKMLDAATQEPVWNWVGNAREYINRLMWG